MTSPEIIARFEHEYQVYHRISRHRARQQSRLLHEFAGSLDGRLLVDLTAADLSGFAAGLVASGYHVNTVRKKLNQIRPFISWAYAVGLIDADRYLKLRAIRNPRGASGSTSPNPYSQTELRALWAVLDERWPKIPGRGRGSRALKRWLAGTGRWPPLRRHAMRLQLDCLVRLALDLGLRKGEIFGLSLDDLHYDNEYLLIRGKADPTSGEVKLREVPITEHARQAIKEWIEFRALLRPGHDRPWLSLWRRDSYDHPMLGRRFDTLLQDTCGAEWRWHRLRHTCATVRLRSGMPLEQVSALLGHASLQQTMCYAKIVREDMERSMEAQHAGFALGVGRAA